MPLDLSVTCTFETEFDITERPKVESVRFILSQMFNCGFSHYENYLLRILSPAKLKLKTLESKEIKQEISDIQKTCMKGDIEGCVKSTFLHGFIIEKGIGEKCDIGAAVEKYKTAAKKGYAPAMYRLAEIYRSGDQGVKQNLSLAKHLYEQAIVLEHSDSMVGLGIMYDKGLECKTSKEKASELFNRASELGNAKAKYHLACQYLGEENTYDKGIKLMISASELGCLPAISFFTSTDNHSLSETNQILTLGIRLGCVNSMEALAEKYKTGNGVKQNFKKSIQLLEKAYYLNSLSAGHQMAIMYLLGEGVTQDLKMAYSLFQENANGGFSISKAFLGLFYLRGDYVKQDSNLAFKLLKEAYDDNLQNYVTQIIHLHIVRLISLNLPLEALMAFEAVKKEIPSLELPMTFKDIISHFVSGADYSDRLLDLILDDLVKGKSFSDPFTTYLKENCAEAIFKRLTDDNTNHGSNISGLNRIVTNEEHPIRSILTNDTIKDIKNHLNQITKTRFTFFAGCLDGYNSRLGHLPAEIQTNILLCFHPGSQIKF